MDQRHSAVTPQLEFNFDANGAFLGGTETEGVTKEIDQTGKAELKRYLLRTSL